MRPRPRILFALVTLALWATRSPADAPLPPHRAEYLLTRDGLPIATMVMELELRPGGGYLYRSSTRPHAALALVGMALDISSAARITEESTGEVADGRFRPTHYRYRRDNQGTRELTVTFDWEARNAAMNSEGKPWSMAVPEGTLDKLAVLLALRQDLAAGTHAPSYPVADGGKLKTYGYQVQGREEITSAAGTWTGVELTRTKDGGTPDYRLWLAPALGYLPVRVERDENGNFFAMDLTAVRGIGVAAPDREGD